MPLYDEYPLKFIRENAQLLRLYIYPQQKLASNGLDNYKEEIICLWNKNSIKKNSVYDKIVYDGDDDILLLLTIRIMRYIFW
jgi:hypothetical protein